MMRLSKTRDVRAARRARWIVKATIALLGSIVPTLALADERYTTRAGDTCEALAKRFFGDERLTDALHTANPAIFDKPPPHHLNPGTVLRIPDRPPERSGPDARLAFVRHDVALETPAARVGKVNDPLLRGYRVNTLADSSARVVFRDETQIQMGEHSLVIILGDIDAAGEKRSNRPGIELESGNLLTRLAAREHAVRTEAALVTVKPGSTRVSVDRSKATRVAVYKGTSEVSAQKKNVVVPEGFGSKAERGKAPTEPRRLPPPPSWSDAAPRLLVSFGPADVAVAYALPDGVEEAHLQLTRDITFDDLLLDANVGRTVAELRAKNLPAGSYRVRASSIDGDKFEGAPGAELAIDIVKLVREDAGRAFYLMSNGPAAARCKIDDLPWVPMGMRVGPISREERHVVSCDVATVAPPSSGRGSTTLVIDSDLLPLPPRRPPTVRPTNERETSGFECSASVGGMRAGEALVQTGGRIGAGCAYRFSLGLDAISFGWSLGYESFGAGPLQGAARPSEISFEQGVLGIPVSYRFLPHRRTLVPYITLTPLLVFQSNRVDTAAAFPPRNDALLAGGEAKLGFQFKLGPGGIFAESGYRGVGRRPNVGPLGDGSGFVLDLGYRFQLPLVE